MTDLTLYRTPVSREVLEMVAAGQARLIESLKREVEVMRVAQAAFEALVIGERAHSKQAMALVERQRELIDKLHARVTELEREAADSWAQVARLGNFAAQRAMQGGVC